MPASNSAVQRALADDVELEGANLRTVRYGKALALVSYSTPVAVRLGDAVLVDARRYSVTTSKQVSGTVLPCHQAGVGWDRVPHDEFRAICHQHGVSTTFAR